MPDGELVLPRKLHERTYDDQVRSLSLGYERVADMAIDELTEYVFRLEQRVTQLEQDVEPREALGD